MISIKTLLPLLLLPIGACASARIAPEPQALPNAGSMMENLPIVNGIIDGQAVTLLLDTGASITCLQPAASMRIGRVPVGISRLGGVGDTTRTVRTFGRAMVELGEFSTVVQSLHGCPTLPLVGRSGRIIDGVMGGDALRGLTVVIDYPMNAVRVLPVWSPVAADSATALPVTFARNLPIITIELQTRGRWHPVSLLLDTGADVSLLLDAALADSLGLESDPYAQPSERRGLGGGIATRSYYVSRARLGTLDVRDLSIEVASSGLTQLFQHGVQGIAGSDFLRHFRLELDLGNGRMSLESPGPGRTVCGTQSGICVAPRPARDGYVVQAVRPRSIAARYSIVPGETILRVGSAEANRMNGAEIRAALAPQNGLVSLWILNTFGRTRRVDFRITE
ncbi:MAG: aspartyl protease family protein [Gemmatimonadaceae bacterium]|nr:aspartyl protease family protein [Gemmatimonadaceae bacterium]